MTPADASSQRRRTLTLHLGVLVQPYRNNPAVTTGDVAHILEDEYGVMGAFYRVHQQRIADAVANSLAGSMQSLLMGQATDPWGDAVQDIQADFRKFINSQEAERVGIPGTPTKAALRGVNHRLKHPYRKSNPRRPSFRDTGLYVADFRAWIE